MHSKKPTNPESITFLGFRLKYLILYKSPKTHKSVCFSLFLILCKVLFWLETGKSSTTMTTKMKGIYKGFKYISQIFVVKDREMEIGYPTDVKHVAHIGWDSQSASAPGWMSDFKASADFSTMSLGSLGGETDPSFVPISSWSSLDFDQSMSRQPVSSEIFNDAPQPKDLPKAPKKHKRKKTKSVSSPKSSSSPSSRSSKVPLPKSSFAATVAATVAEIEIKPSHKGLLL